MQAAPSSRSSLANDGSRRLENLPDASRAEPYVMVLEAGAGFATPATRSGTESETPGRASFAGSGSGASPDTLTRAHTSPFSVPLTQRVRAHPLLCGWPPRALLCSAARGGQCMIESSHGADSCLR